MKKILIAEDDYQIRTLMAHTIEELGYVCIQCSSGTKALHTIQDNPDVDLLITDMVMPELSGEDLIKILRCREATKEIPIVIISAITRYEDIAHLLDLGASRFLTKPIDFEELEISLRELLSVT
ncbi:MAG: response regulator [Acidobacteriota bacterium]|nr:response regulator [Acidobacteriota bacterium]